MAVRVENYRSAMPLGKSAYLDTNFLISVLDVTLGRPTEPKYLFADLLKQGVRLLVSPLAMDEAWWTLLHEWNKQAGHKDIRNNLKKKPDIYLTPYMPVLKTFLTKIEQWPRVEWVDLGHPTSHVAVHDAIITALEHIAVWHLMPRDAFHIQCAIVNSADILVTSDPDFARLDGMSQADLLIVQTP